MSNTDMSDDRSLVFTRDAEIARAATIAAMGRRLAAAGPRTRQCLAGRPQSVPIERDRPAAPPRGKRLFDDDPDRLTWPDVASIVRRGAVIGGSATCGFAVVLLGLRVSMAQSGAGRDAMHWLQAAQAALLPPPASVTTQPTPPPAEPVATAMASAAPAAAEPPTLPVPAEPPVAVAPVAATIATPPAETPPAPPPAQFAALTQAQFAAPPPVPVREVMHLSKPPVMVVAVLTPRSSAFPATGAIPVIAAGTLPRVAIARARPELMAENAVVQAPRLRAHAPIAEAFLVPARLLRAVARPHLSHGATPVDFDVPRWLEAIHAASKRSVVMSEPPHILTAPPAHATDTAAAATPAPEANSTSRSAAPAQQSAVVAAAAPPAVSRPPQLVVASSSYPQRAAYGWGYRPYYGSPYGGQYGGSYGGGYGPPPYYQSYGGYYSGSYGSGP